MTNVLFAANYSLTVDGEQYDISLDQETVIKVGGKDVSVKLEQKDIFSYSVDNFSFQHPREYIPSRSSVGDNGFQTIIVTPLGTMVMIQEDLYAAPSLFMDMMIDEITKEEREYGYTIESTQTSRTLADGKVVNGKMVTSKYKGSDIKRFFYTYGTKDSGLFMVTQFDFEVEPNGEELIDMVLNSLKITMD